MTPDDVAAALATKCAAAGLSPADAVRLQLAPLTAEEIPSTFPIQKAAIRIPYFSPAGAPLDFYRVRYVEETREGFALQTTAKPLRYAQAYGSAPHVYFPPLFPDPWSVIGVTPALPLWITEGEFKAAAAGVHHIPCLGLGGVWMFQKAGAWIADMDGIVWEGRIVVIAFDSDASTNPQVSQARNVLAKGLLDRGAKPTICHLPALPGVPKTGLDDFLMARGVEALRALPLEEYAAARALHELNDEVIYVTDPGMVVVRSSLQAMRVADFTGHAYAHRTYEERIEKGKTVKVEVRSAPVEWIKWPHRAAAARLTYAPGREKFLPTGEWNVWPGWGVEPIEGDVSPWWDLLCYVFPEPAERSWFEQWCAYPLQHPGTKLYTATLIWSTHQGVGKTLLGYTLAAIYGRNAVEIQDEHLSSSFNEWARHRQFVIGDELTGGKNQRPMAHRIKSIVTRHTVRINPKHVPEYSLPDCINYFFTSNEPDAFLLDDHDRRFFVQEVIDPPLARAFYERYDAWLKGDGPAHLFARLLTLPLDSFNPRAGAPMTWGKHRMIEDGKSDLAEWVTKLRFDPDATLQHTGKRFAYWLWTAQELVSIYDPTSTKRVTPNGMARELHRQGYMRAYKGAGVPTTFGHPTMWMIRHPAKLLLLTGPELAAQYENERGIAQTPLTEEGRLDGTERTAGLRVDGKGEAAGDRVERGNGRASRRPRASVVERSRARRRTEGGTRRPRGAKAKAANGR